MSGVYQIFTGSRSAVVTHPCSREAPWPWCGSWAGWREVLNRMYWGQQLTRSVATQPLAWPGHCTCAGRDIATRTRIPAATEMCTALPSTLFRPIQLPAPRRLRIELSNFKLFKSLKLHSGSDKACLARAPLVEWTVLSLVYRKLS